MKKKEFQALVAEDVKKVEKKKIKFSKICGDLWKLVNNFERNFISVSDSTSKIGPFLTYFETVENITNIDFIGCDDGVKRDFEDLIDELHKIFSTCPFYLTVFEDFWAKIDKIYIYLCERIEKIAKKIALAEMEDF